MPQTVKLPYFPAQVVESKTSHFGALLLEGDKHVYDKGLSGKQILRVDLIRTLDDIWGEQLTTNRKLAHKLLAGNFKDDDELRKVIISLYTRNTKFSEYVDECVLFGDSSESDITKIIKPAREMIDARAERIKKKAEMLGGKFLLEGDEYIYYAYQVGAEIPEIHGSEVL